MRNQEVVDPPYPDRTASNPSSPAAVDTQDAHCAERRRESGRECRVRCCGAERASRSATACADAMRRTLSLEWVDLHSRAVEDDREFHDPTPGRDPEEEAHDDPNHQEHHAHERVHASMWSVSGGGEASAQGRQEGGR